MKKRILIFVIISAGLLLLTIWLLHRSNSEKKTSGTIHAGAMSIGETGKSRSRSEWEFNRLRDPVTNTIPADIRRGELEYARTLPKAEIKQKSTSWISRGPYNVGGRTRGAAIDVTDDNIIIAGGVSGGLWRSTDGGNTWSKMTQPDQLHNVTCIVQDTRPGKTNSWYYGTGESYGNSANEGFTAAFLGDGIYKSTDGGITWNWLESTHSGTPHVYDKWDYIWNIVVDPSCDTADIIYAACYKCLQRSTDGGETWTELIPFVNQGSWFTDVAVTTTGVVYTTFSADGTQKGIFRSGDGVNFNSILPGPSTDTIDTIPFPSAYYRIVIGINPANENEVYFLANTPSYGQHSDVFFGGEEWNSLWKYTYISGNGSGYGGTWQDLSYNLPANSPYPFENLYVQSSYDMAIRVKPDEPDVIFIGGTNIYRSTDGFTSSDNTKQIGGYKPGSVDTDWDIWPVHHPDQHVFLFPSGEPDAMISANDGGLFRTSDCTADSVIWQRLNNGYVTSQFYTIYINEQGTDDIIIGGFQDNGNFFTNSADPASEWTMPLNGDGSFGHICNNGEYYIMSIQQGRVFKLQLDADGNALAFARIDPIGPAKDDYDFINPLAVDPNNNDILYIPCYRAVYRNNMLSQIPLNNNIDSISTGWFKFTYEPSYYVSAIAVSTVPADRVYYGCSGRVYRIDSAGTSDPATHPMYVMPTSNPGNISCIAVDPRDADKVMVVMSNYLRYSLFYTEDGFTTIYKVAGNMEQYATGAGNGPSLRWATIMPVGDSTLYLLGTSVGLFATGSLRLDADSTIWTDVGHGIIGNVVVEMIKTRETDNMVVVATHGNGCYSMKLNSIDELFNNISNTGMAGIKDELNLYPNPAKDHLNIDFSLKKASGIEISLFDGSGRIVKKQSCGQLIKGIHHERINLEGCGNGVFFIIVNSNNGRMSGKFLVE